MLFGGVSEGKEESFRKASVGIVNPSNRTDIFGMEIVRMLVVTIGKNGCFDSLQLRN